MSGPAHPSTQLLVARRPSTVWERSVRRVAIGSAVLVLLAFGVVAFALARRGVPLGLSLPLSALVAGFVFVGKTGVIRRRHAIMAQPFPPEWEAVLVREVAFFRALDPEQKERFRGELQLFLGEKRITGIKLDMDTATRVLVGASAVIPIFGFPDWEWQQINEVLVYPNRFDDEFGFGDGEQRQILGMVGTGALNRVMILSQPDLLAGFRNPGDKRNVGIHEFAHLLDKSDGSIDGLPAVGLDQASAGPWIELVRRKMEEMRRGESDIDSYGLTNEAEFFAVASVYFFERPGVMERKHPELYKMMARVFNQNLIERAAAITRELNPVRPTFGRNSPCPCGSGLKFKKCCLSRTGRVR